MVEDPQIFEIECWYEKNYLGAQQCVHLEL
jgi:hypothetical protein